MKKTGKQKGAVLIVVLGVLVILALLATTFATLQQLDRTVSRNYVDDVRAKLLAQSGVEYAISEVRNMMASGFFNSSSSSTSWVYYGDQTDEAQAANPATPIELAKNPSWAQELDNNPATGAATPRQITVRRPDGSTYAIGYSAAHETGRYARNGDIYSLRVVDASGMIYVNDGLYQYGGNNSTVSLNLRRILNTLGQHPSVGIALLGDKILNNRGSGYISKYDLRKAVNYNDTDFNKFKDFVAVNAWVDKNVVNPVPLSSAMESQYPIDYWRGNMNQVFRRGRGYDQWWSSNNGGTTPDWWNSHPLRWYPASGVTNMDTGIFGHDELFPQYVEVVWRAPVNVNTAAEPVLSALLADVSGFFSMERRRFQPYAGSPANQNFSGYGYGGSYLSFTIPQQYYRWMDVQHTFSPGGTGGDEIGFLYRTAAIYAPGTGSVSGGVSAQTISNHIIACRQKGNYGGVDYSTKAFGGPFKNWAQFYAFLDFLVEQSILWDGRQIYGDYPSSMASPCATPSFTLAATNSANNKFGSYAMADALKANFNPNCVLNETNPDRHMYLRVDKTDLIVNSTEFCFTPMGYYEIESLGRVLRPEQGSSDALALTAGEANQIVAEKKILVTVKLYDAYRESSQRHFYGGTLNARQTNPETNNNRSVETGPENDNGPMVYADLYGMSSPVTMTPALDGYAGYAPGTSSMTSGWGYEYAGWIGLPTMGSDWLSQTGQKPLGATYVTLAGGPHLGSVIHSHFRYDFKAHHHASAADWHGDSFRDDLGGVLRTANQFVDQIPYTRPPKIERALNFPDPGEGLVAGPYCRAQNAKYREARSFRLPMQSGSGTTTIPFSLTAYAPSDLRIDGAYSERHNGIAYWMDQGVSWNEQDGLMSAWVKPSFYPEWTGKLRKVFGMSRWHYKNFYYRNPNLWDMFYMPAHDSLPYQISAKETTTPAYVGSPYSTCSDAPPEAAGGKGVFAFRPMSLMTTWGAHCFDGSLADFYDEGPWLEEENYSCTASLNHRLHGANSWNGHGGLQSYLDKGRWAHITLRWHETQGSYIPTDQHWIETYVNGEIQSGHAQPYAGSIFLSSYKKRYFTIQSFEDNPPTHWLTNTIRLGETSSHGFGTFNRNYSADMTFDEFYVWAPVDVSASGTQLNSGAFTLWKNGRYYRPGLGANKYADALYISKQINLDSVSPSRSLAPPSSTATPPYTTGTSGTAGSTITTTAPKKRLLGVSWTWMAEDYVQSNGKLIPVAYSHYSPSNPTPLYQTDTGTISGNPEAAVRVFITVDGQKFPLGDVEGYRNDAFSAIVGSDGKPYQMTNAQDIRYQVWFSIKGVTASSILLATPYFEDITLYYDTGDVEFLLYALVNT